MIGALRRFLNDVVRPVRAVGLAVAVRVLGAGLAVSVHLGLVRLMGADAYGIFIFSYTALLVAGTLALIGMDRAVTRFSAAAWALADYETARSVILVGTAIALLGSLICSSGIVISMLLTKNSSVIAYQTTLLIGAFSLPLFVLHRVREGVANGLQRMGHVTIPEHIVRQPLLFVMVVAFGWVCQSAPSAEAVMILYVLSMAILVVGGTVALYVALPGHIRRGPMRKGHWNWIKTSPAMMFGGGMELIFTQVDILVVGVLLGGEAAALYAVASRLSNLLIYVSRAIDLAVFPAAADSHARGDLGKLRQLTKAAGRAGVFSVGLGGLAMGLLSEEFLGFFGPEFISASDIVTVLIVSCFCRVVFGPGAAVLSGTGNHNISAATMVGAIGVNVVLNIVLVHALGLIGAALATLISTILLGTLNAFFAKLRTGVLTVVH